MLRVISLKGDSMEPTLSDGDIALVRIGEGDPVNEPGVYCMWDGNGLMVKRLQVLPGTVARFRILSDNSALYPPYEVSAEDVRLIGRIIWRAGSL
jgi:phage repressor protein C with HTH and peptisase S24 domain